MDIKKANNKKVTIYDVSNRLGLSTASVNRALNDKPGISEDTRKRVIETAKEMGYKASKTASSLSRRPIKIGVIINKIPFDFFQNDILLGMKNAFNELSDFKVTGELYFAKQNADKEEYESAIMKMADSGCDGIAILPSSIERGFDQIIEKMKARGIIVGTVVSDFPNSKRDFSVRTNGFLAGKIAAQILYWLAGSEPVALVTGYRDLIIHSETIQGFKSFMESRPMNFAGIYEHSDDPEIAYYLAARMIKEKPYIKGIYLGTANSATFCKRLDEMGCLKDIKIVASDLSPEIIAYINNGKVDATIFQNPYSQGKTVITKMYKIIAENLKLEKDVFYLYPQPVFASNLEVFIPESFDQKS